MDSEVLRLELSVYTGATILMVMSGDRWVPWSENVDRTLKVTAPAVLVESRFHEIYGCDPVPVNLVESTISLVCTVLLELEVGLLKV